MRARDVAATRCIAMPSAPGTSAGRPWLPALALAGLVGLALAGGCATGFAPHPPPGWLRPVAEVAHNPDGYGAWALLRFYSQPRQVEGELIEIGPGGVLVLTADGLVSRPIAHLDHATFAIGYDHTGSTALESIPGADWRRMVRYARFPGGVPAGIDPRALLPKPWP